jgi:hypothetical protein
LGCPSGSGGHDFDELVNMYITHHFNDKSQRSKEIGKLAQLNLYVSKEPYALI